MVKSLVFVSNFFNHHQKFISDEFVKLLGYGYTFIEMIPMDVERQKLGYVEYDEPYLLRTHISEDNHQKALKLINEADVVITGFASKKFLNNRIKKGKIIFRYSERLFKGKYKLIKFPIRFIRYNFWNPRNKQIYLLCSSAYTSADFKKMFLFKNKSFKWGYFPEVHTYNDIDQLIRRKEQNSILWCGRIIDFKHLEHAIYAVKKLIDKKYDIHFNIIGDGVLKEHFIELVNDLGIEKNVKFLGIVRSNVVRSYMEKSSIYLFTSNFDEGWGAVLNESMNSACAVISSHAAGAAPFLISHNINGLLYTSGDVDELTSHIEFLLNNPKKAAEFGKEAYKTIVNTWSPKTAAERFLKLSNSIIKKSIITFEDGPCSIAKPIKNNWYKKENNKNESFFGDKDYEKNIIDK